MNPQSNSVYVLALSYGKDSLACQGAIEQLGWPLDRIIHAEVWATNTIPADPPPMIEFKKKADAIIKERYGIEVEHVCAERERERECFERMFYSVRFSKKRGSSCIYGWPMVKGPWCNDRLKVKPLKLSKDNKNTVVRYLGIASDEPERLARLDGITKISPLAAVGWTEADCMKWCEENDLLSPIYTTATRGGCWFCHNQSIDQLRLLRKNHPDLWNLMLKWDKDSPISFKPDGHTVHDFDRRFKLEESGHIPMDRTFRWKMLDLVERQDHISSEKSV